MEKVFGFHMAKVAEVYLSTLSAIMKPHGLDRFFKPLLVLCDNSGVLTQKDFAELIRKDKVSTMRTVDFLCKRGFVERIENEQDKRCYILEATPKAFEIKPLIEEAITKTNTIIFADFTAEEMAVYTTCIDKLNKRISDLPEPDFIVKAFKRNKETSDDK